MKNLPHSKTLPAHYLDKRTQEMVNDAIAGIKFHSHNNCKPALDQAQVEKELALFYNQMEALDKPIADNLKPFEKETLRNYYKAQIRRRKAQLSVFVTGLALTDRAININVIEPTKI